MISTFIICWDTTYCPWAYMHKFGCQMSIFLKPDRSQLGTGIVERELPRWMSLAFQWMSLIGFFENCFFLRNFPFFKFYLNWLFEYFDLFENFDILTFWKFWPFWKFSPFENFSLFENFYFLENFEFLKFFDIFKNFDFLENSIFF